jgi:hypothetical protein
MPVVVVEMPGGRVLQLERCDSRNHWFDYSMCRGSNRSGRVVDRVVVDKVVVAE